MKLAVIAEMSAVIKISIWCISDGVFHRYVSALQSKSLYFCVLVKWDPLSMKLKGLMLYVHLIKISCYQNNWEY